MGMYICIRVLEKPLWGATGFEPVTSSVREALCRTELSAPSDYYKTTNLIEKKSLI